MCMWPMQSYRAPYSKGLCAWGLMLCGCLLEILNNLSLNLCFKWSLVGQGGMCPGFRTSNYMWSYLQLPPYDGFLVTCYQPFGTLNLACLLPPCPHLMSPLPPLGSILSFVLELFFLLKFEAVWWSGKDIKLEIRRHISLVDSGL